MRDRAILTLGYTTIVATIAAGVLGLAWWAAVACASVLGLISLTASFGAYARYVYAGSPISLPAVFTSTVVNAISAGAAAYLLGRVVGWVWGF